MAQQYKVDKVNFLKKYFDDSSSYIFNNFSGLTVEKITNLRRNLYKLNTKFIVIKNNFIKRILSERQLSGADDNLAGPTAVAFVKDDVSNILKILFDFSKESVLKVKGGFADGVYFNDKGLEELSKLPGRKELLSMLMRTMNAPMQNFVYCCNDVVTRLARVLNAVAETKK
jgi:large subunit ribosomal protein L10